MADLDRLTIPPSEALLGTLMLSAICELHEATRRPDTGAGSTYRLTRTLVALAALTLAAAATRTLIVATAKTSRGVPQNARSAVRRHDGPGLIARLAGAAVILMMTAITAAHLAESASRSRWPTRDVHIGVLAACAVVSLEGAAGARELPNRL
jgi:hypothetical protein